MPRDLFGNVTQPFDGVGARSRYTVPLSLAAHTVVVAAIVVVPLVASDALPALRERLELSMVTPLVPPEPPRPRVMRPAEVAVANPNAAPLDVPDRITEEPAWQSDPMATANDGPGILNGVIDGVDTLEPPPPPPVEKPPAKVTVGGFIKAPAKIHDAAPVYPAIAQSARVQGIVIIQATIGVDGHVIDATVLRSVPLLDEAALAAVRQWRYTPTRLNGAPVAVVMTVTVNFMLR
jgi:periplasmic protein TonB